jgi:hypothetical protein
MRPRQWSKNLLLFAGIIFAAEVGDLVRWAEAGVAFAAYCAASSAAYLVNDVRDAAHDRLHPLKRLRPVARGELSPKTALLLAGVLAVLAAALVAPLGLLSLAFLAGFLALQGAYSFGLKHVVLVDVLAIAVLFVIRSAAGAEAVDVRISPWLLLCTALLALFLALGQAQERARPARRGPARARGLLARARRPADHDHGRLHHRRLLRLHDYRALVGHGRDDPVRRLRALPLPAARAPRRARRAPESVLLTDRPLIAAISLWAVTSAAILAATS